MKTILALAFVLGSFAAVAAEKNDQSFREQWTCYASGSINMGYPGGSIPMTVMGHGETQMEAMSDAQQRCFSQGLQMCMIQNCFKK